MQVKELYADQFQVVAVMQGDDCAAESFLSDGDAMYKVNRDGLRAMLEMAAELGLERLPTKWLHEADKQNKIYEFKKGQLRLFFFGGSNGQIAVCTTGVLKKTPKADKAAVAAAVKYRDAYLAAVKAGTLQVIRDEDQ